jgi:hypothetical protein
MAKATACTCIFTIMKISNGSDRITMTAAFGKMGQIVAYLKIQF